MKIETLEELEQVRPTLRLSGRDGNAFSILAGCKKAARKGLRDASELNRLQTEMFSGDYDHVIQTAL